MHKQEEAKLIAEIIAGTKRKKRRINVLKVADNLRALHEQHKSLVKVANIVDLSPEMVRQFIKLNSLPNEVKKLFKDGHLSGVDIGYRISKLERKDQIAIAQRLTVSKL
ncbi:MAG: hypothetical protein AB1442_11305, partial [Nitrospirota bacterium]